MARQSIASGAARYAIVFALLSPLICAADTEATTSSTAAAPPQRLGWVHEPEGRGTWSLIWSCLFTWFICLWQVVLLNAPGYREKESAWYIRKIGCFALGAIAPELIVTMAFTQWRGARAFVAGVKEIRDEQQRSSLNKSTGEATKHDASISFSGNDADDCCTIVHGFYCVMGGFVVTNDEDKTFPVNEEQFLWLVKNSVIDLPAITNEEIKDKSKADSLIKLIAGLQAMWFILQCIGRAAQRLATTTLEITTAAYVICIIPALFFWWHKPVDVKIPTRLRLRRPWPEDATQSLRNRDPLTRQFFWSDRNTTEFPRAVNTVEIDQKRPASSDHGGGRGERFFLPNWCFLLSIAVLYGGIHTIAWGFDFASVFEAMAWRACSLFIILVALFTASKVGLIAFLEAGKKRWAVTMAVEKIVVAFYVSARTYLLVEVFLAFRSMPAGVYASVDWSKYFPFI